MIKSKGRKGKTKKSIKNRKTLWGVEKYLQHVEKLLKDRSG